jgi:hypothetical protein
MGNDFQFESAHKVFGVTDKELQRRRELLRREKELLALKNYWQKMPDDFLAKREDREVYDIEEAGMAIGAEVGVLKIFQRFLEENFINQGILLANVDETYFKQCAGGERLLQHLRVAGYDFEKLMKYWRGKYNKYRINWFNFVFGEAQLLLAEIDDEKKREAFENEMQELILRRKMVYSAPIQSVEDPKEKEAARAERALLVDAVDEFIEKLVEYCRGNS